LALKIAQSETVPLMKPALFSFCKCYVIISISIISNLAFVIIIFIKHHVVITWEVQGAWRH